MTIIQTRYSKPLLLRVTLILGLAIIIPATGLVAGRLVSPDAAAAPVFPALAVSVLTVDTSNGYDLRRVFTGFVEANRVSGLGFERSGLLLEVLAREGESVGAGQVLARLDPALLQAQRRELKAALTLAEATLARYKQSVDQGAATRQALDEAREGASAARAGVELARPVRRRGHPASGG